MAVAQAGARCPSGCIAWGNNSGRGGRSHHPRSRIGAQHTDRDCLPLLLTAEDGSEIAAVHCGWRGLASGIVGNTIQAMQTPSELVLAWMGPAIGPCHFEVGRDVYDALSAILSEDALASAFTPATGEKFMANLYEVATALLRKQGVLRISGGGLCTSCDQRRFFSYRVSPVCGRIATTICIRAA